MNFVLWGLYFALLLVLENAFLLRILEKLPRAAGHLYTMLAVIISWAIFAPVSYTHLDVYKRQTQYGMSDDFDMVALETVTNQYLGGDTSLVCSSELQSKVDYKVIELVKEQHEKAKRILEENRTKLDEDVYKRQQ